MEIRAMSECQSIRTQYSTSPTLVESASFNYDDPDSIIRDLQQRVTNWAGADPSVLGQLCLHDTLKIRKGVQERQFDTYLFKEAIICLAEQKRKRTTLGSALGVFGAKQTLSSSSSPPTLNLKGRIFTRHIKRIRDTSTDDEWILTVDMRDDHVKNVDSFVIIFPNQWSLKRWHTELATTLSDYGLGKSVKAY